MTPQFVAQTTLGTNNGNELSCVPFTAVGVTEEAFVAMLFPRGFGSTLPALFLVKPGCRQRVCPPWRSDEKPNIFPGSSFLRAWNRTGPMRPSTGQNPVDETTTHSGVVKPSFANFRDDSILQEFNLRL